MLAEGQSVPGILTGVVCMAFDVNFLPTKHIWTETSCLVSAFQVHSQLKFSYSKLSIAGSWKKI